MITYDQVAEWWENSDWNMSTYPPSTWHEYCVLEGIDLDELMANPAKHEADIEELQSAGDNRTCECEWAEHEKGCSDASASN